MEIPTLSWDERLHYRDRFRAARYSALADSEGFSEICFAIEALGLRLKGREAAMRGYQNVIRSVANDSMVLSHLTQDFPTLFTTFDALYETVRCARNDVMHSGVYARHATTAAIEMCIGLEEALMKEQQQGRELVADYMVKAPVILESWQPLAHARQLMLTHSFSYLPVNLNGWHLVSEISMARHLHRTENRSLVLATSIEAAVANGLSLMEATVVEATTKVAELLSTENGQETPMLWLVGDGHGGLSGVLSPFELM